MNGVNDFLLQCYIFAALFFVGFDTLISAVVVFIKSAVLKCYCSLKCSVLKLCIFMNLAPPVGHFWKSTHSLQG